MNFIAAKRYAKQGYHIRRSVWLEDVATPVAGSSNKRVTAWLAYSVGAWIYRSTDGVTPDRIVEEGDIDVADLQAVDWTLADAEQNPQQPPVIPPDTGGGTLPPLPPVVPPGSSTGGGGGGESSGGGTGGGSGGGSGGSGSGGSSGGSGGSGSGGGGGGGGGTGGGSDEDGSTKNKPNRKAPTLQLKDLTRASDACIPLVGGLENTTPITDSFTCNLELGPDPDARPGEVWFFSVMAAGKVRRVGTLAAGDSVGLNFSVTAEPGTAFPVQATAHLPNKGLTCQASDFAATRGACGLAPVITGFHVSGGHGPSESGFVLVVNDYETDPIFYIQVDGSWAEAGLKVEWLCDGEYVEAGSLPRVNNHVAYTASFLCRVTNNHGAASLNGSIQILDID